MATPDVRPNQNTDSAKTFSLFWDLIGEDDPGNIGVLPERLLGITCYKKKKKKNLKGLVLGDYLNDTYLHRLQGHKQQREIQLLFISVP